MARGVLKWFNQVSDYGFIACDEGGPDRYVRGENVMGSPSQLLAGARVEFKPRLGGMGPEAIGVRRLAPIRRRNTGSFEPSRRHGPFDPRFRRPQVVPLPALNSRDVQTKLLQAAGAVEGWESEGGALAGAL